MIDQNIDPRDLHSFPTRRSSDLRRTPTTSSPTASFPIHRRPRTCISRSSWWWRSNREAQHQSHQCRKAHLRSEEHTSELQSPYDLVCRLLLEKKKQNKKH